MSAYEVLAVRYGTRRAMLSEVFQHYAAYGRPDGAIQMDYFFWVARSADHTVLVDCGFSRASGERRGRTMVCEPSLALDRIGVEPDSVSHLIVTHAHYDHIGNLALAPRAEIVIARREYEFWTGPLGGRPLFAQLVEQADLDALSGLVSDRLVRFVSGRHLVLPGMEVIEVGGHTPGQLVVLIRGRSAEVLLASDAAHYYLEAEAGMPFSHTADLIGAYAGYEQIRELAGGPVPRVVVPGHDPIVMTRFEPYAAAADIAVTVG